MKNAITLTMLFFLINIRLVSAGEQILLKSRRFIPAEGITTAAKAKIEAIPQRAHVIIQLEKIPTIKERKELETKRIKLLSYIPNKAWLASIPSNKAGEIAALSSVRSICEFLPQDKIASAIREKGVNNYSTNEKGEAKLAIIFFDDVSLNKASDIISTYNGTVIETATTINALVVYLSKNLIDELAKHDAVHWIDQHYEPIIANDGSREAINVEEVQASPYNLTGAGVIAGEWDGGCVDNMHHDLWDRVTWAACEGFIDEHATHVAGTMLGNGCRSLLYGGTDLQWRGMATIADVISYQWWESVPELYIDYDDAIKNHHIDLANHSWGYPYWAGVYDLYTKAEDDVVIGACGKRIPVIRAAGNEGDDFGWRSLRNQAVAKNIITVGATNSNDNSLTSFSSRGPTADGRIKPDVMAAGCQVGGDEGIKSTIPGNTYGVNCGTSMAAPAVSGSVALMLEDWRDNHSDEPDPLPSTIKAILIQTAEDLVNTPCNTGPDYSSGYGLINTQSAIDLIREDTSNNVILENSIFGSGDTDTFTVDVPSGQSELKITLVWDDYPGDFPPSKALVNDLDLIVTEPDLTRRYPWTLNPLIPQDPAIRTEVDHLNNVEQVWVENPASGIWTIEISETEVPEPAQVYSLVSNFAFGPAPPCAYDDDLFTKPGTSLEIDLRATDDSLPDPPGELTYIVTSLPSIGTLSEPGIGQISSVPYTLSGNGNQVIYMSNIGGPDTFKFKANDGGTPPSGGDSDEATIDIDVLGLEGWWKLDEIEGTEAEDSIGDNDGEVSYGTWTDGKINGALQFDGSSVGYVLLDPINTLKGDSVSITAWVKPHDLYGPNRIYYPIVSTYKYPKGYFLYIGKPSTDYHPIFYLDGEWVTSNERIFTTDWYHIAGTYDGETLSIYNDGVGKHRNISDLTGFYENYDNTYIGHENNISETAYSFSGKIDDVRVYYGALDSFGIWDAMSGELPRFRINNSEDETVAWFDRFGNLFLKGEELTNPANPIPSGSFIIKNSTGQPVAYIDNQGNLWIAGNKSQGGCDPQEDAFKIQDSSGTTTVSYIDSNGNLCLSGNLYQNPN